MATPPPPPSSRTSVRTRVLALAVTPSLIIVSAGLGIGWYLSGQAVQARSEADLVVRKVDVGGRLYLAALDEQRAGALGRPDDLTAARAEVDRVSAEVAALQQDPAGAPAPGLQQAIARIGDAVAGVPLARQQIRAGLRGIAAYEAFRKVTDPAAAGLDGNVVDGTDADVDGALDGTVSLLRIAGAVRAADTVAALTPGASLDRDTYPAFAAQVASLDDSLDSTVGGLDGPARDRVEDVIASAQWKLWAGDAAARLGAGPATGATDGDGTATTPVGRPTVSPDLAVAGPAVADTLARIAVEGARDAAALQADRAAAALAWIVGAVLATVAAAVVALLVAVRMGRRLVDRLDRLREDTLSMAAMLPDTLDRLRQGEDVEIRTALADHGHDEIGLIAGAVDAAQRAAVVAAGEEARTLAGANAVFLNIAHRSQAIVHRQLQVLDEAERAEHNPEQLARLYQLDHLTTRERRNAENLIIMGGQQPGRRWRRPVSMVDLMRSAVSESEQYTRITLGDVPEVFVDGAAVGDLIHLLAELVDNATAFSPPQCAIDVAATAVGRGVVIEVRDRGLGIDEEPRARLNAMLADPPDFGLMTLSEDSRLGMFVVARLAHQHGVRVTLTESAYGGVQVIVLVPTAIIVEAPDPDRSDPDPDPAEATTPAAGIPAADETADETAAETAAGAEPAEAGDPPADPAGSAPETGTGAPPALPERRPQVHLASRLRDDPPVPDDATPTPPETERPPQRSGAAMSAMQQGSRNGRTGPERNGSRP